MVDSWEHRDGGLLAGGLDERGRHRYRNAVVGVAVDVHVAHPERKARPGRRVEERRRVVAEQLADRAGSETELVGEREVAHRGQGEHARDLDAGVRATGRRQQREVAPGRVAHDGDAVEVEAALVERGQRCDRLLDVLERGRPASARSQPAVLDIPGGDASPLQVAAHGVHQLSAEPRAPEAAVDRHGDGKPIAAVGEIEVGDLVGVGAVAVGQGSGGRRSLQRVARS